MRRMLLRASALSIGLAALWITALPLGAGRGGGGFRGGSFHASGGGGGTARVGSVHYGGREDPAPFAPAVHPGMVRNEHYGSFDDRAEWGGRIGWGRYRSPYRDEYFRLFPPGYRTILLGDALYYIYDSLPLGCPPVLINGITYYSCGGVYYQPYLYGGQTVYMVAPF